MENNYLMLLTNGIEKLGLQISSKQMKQITLFYDELVRYNPVLKLVGAEGDDLIIKHFLDCLAGVKEINKKLNINDTLADFGSGAGFPGILLAILFENHNIYLIERMGRRAKFLRSTISLLGLTDRVEIIEKDISEIKRKFDLITFRAFRPLKDVIVIIERLLSEKGTICAYKGLHKSVEIENEIVGNILPKVFKSEIVDIDVPFLNESRTLYFLLRG